MQDHNEDPGSTTLISASPGDGTRCWKSCTVTPLTLFQLVRVVINVVDINDHDPVFPTDWLTLDVVESASVGSSFSLPEAEDADSQPLSVSGYRLLDGSSTFQLDIDLFFETP